MKDKNIYKPKIFIRVVIMTLSLVSINACTTIQKAIAPEAVAVIPQKIYKATKVKFNDGGILP
jgi:hypothetical protein